MTDFEKQFAAEVARWGSCRVSYGSPTAYWGGGQFTDLNEARKAGREFLATHRKYSDVSGWVTPPVVGLLVYPTYFEEVEV